MQQGKVYVMSWKFADGTIYTPAWAEQAYMDWVDQYGEEPPVGKWQWPFPRNGETFAWLQWEALVASDVGAALVMEHGGIVNLLTRHAWPKTPEQGRR